MIFSIIFFLLSATVTESLFEGESCKLTNGSPGICTFLIECQSVYDELLAGSSRPDTVCGYKTGRVDPIVCCPTNEPNVTVVRQNLDPPDEGDGRGEISRKKCLEYSEFAWTWKYPPFEGAPPVKKSQCAIETITLITGGEKAAQREFPHMAAIGYNNSDTGGISWWCGGTLISETFVLTAAHCIYVAGSGYAVLVRVGDLNLKRSDDGATPEDRRIVERIMHPEYKPPSQYHDIALLRLETRVPFNGWIRPACLHTKPSTGTERAVATGWGRVQWMDESSDDLLKVTLSLLDSQICQKQWNADLADRSLPSGLNLESMICTSDVEKDTCQGDSGGPLVVISNKTIYFCMYDVVGVTSLGRLCGSGFPSVYTRVYHYVPWIESIVWPQG